MRRRHLSSPGDSGCRKGDSDEVVDEFLDICQRSRSVSLAAGGLRQRRQRREDAVRRADAGGDGQGHLPLRHVRRRDVLDRHAADARGHPAPRSIRRPRCPSGSRSTPTRCRPRSWPAIQDGAISLDQPGDHGRAAEAQRRRRRKGTVETVNGTDTLTRVGITCALCHSTVDNSFAPGIGKRLDGWPNRDLNPGAIIALSPALDAEQKAVYNSWGPGKYDPRFNLDGKNGPQVIPPAYGLHGINQHHRHRRRRRHRVLEPLRRRHADGRARHVHRAAHRRRRHQRHRRPVVVEAAGAAGVPAEHRRAPAARGQLRRGRRRARARWSSRARASARPATAASTFTDANSSCTPERGRQRAGAERRARATRRAARPRSTGPRRCTGVWQHPPYFHNGSAATLADVVTITTPRSRWASRPGQKDDLVQYLKSL